MYCVCVVIFFLAATYCMKIKHSFINVIQFSHASIQGLRQQTNKTGRSPALIIAQHAFVMQTY